MSYEKMKEKKEVQIPASVHCKG